MTSPLHDRTADTLAPTPAPVPDAAFDDLFRCQWSSVVNYLRFRVGPQGAQDLAADVFTRAWERRQGFDGARGDLSTWLWAIARNTATSRLRLHTPLTLPLEAADGSQDLTPEPAVDPDELDRVAAGGAPLPTMTPYPTAALPPGPQTPTPPRFPTETAEPTPTGEDLPPTEHTTPIVTPLPSSTYLPDPTSTPDLPETETPWPWPSVSSVPPPLVTPTAASPPTSTVGAPGLAGTRAWWPRLAGHANVAAPHAHHEPDWPE